MRISKTAIRKQEQLVEALERRLFQCYIEEFPAVKEILVKEREKLQLLKTLKYGVPA